MKIRVTAWIVLASLSTFAQLARAGSISYSALDLGSGLAATGINDSGTVVGYYTQGTNVMWYYSNGALMTFTAPGINGYSEAIGVNNAGVIVGDGYVNPNSYSQPYVGFIDDHGSFQIVSYPPGGTVGLSAINNHNVAAGGYALDYSNFYYDSLTYSKGTFNSLGAYSNSWVNYALGINDSGVVVGYYSNPNSNHGDHAYSYSNGAFSPLGNLPGGDQSDAVAINNAGTIAGWSTITGGFTRAFSYSNGTMTNLGTLSGFLFSAASGINSSGEIVGYLSNTNVTGAPLAFPTDHGFLYTDGEMIDLNSVLSQNIGTTLIDAIAINDSGQIIAEGSNGDAYLLTPTSVPEPASLAFVLGATAAVLVWRYRRLIKLAT